MGLCICFKVHSPFWSTNLQRTRHASVKTSRAFASLHRMSNGSLGTGSVPISRRVGLAGALARFSQRSYAADYIALGFLALGWVMVS